MKSTPICPACRFVLRLLSVSHAMGKVVFYDGTSPDHLPNCPARNAGRILGMRVMTHIELPGRVTFQSFQTCVPRG